MPWARADRCSDAAAPTARRRLSCGVAARSPTVRMPRRCSGSAVRAPTPHSAVTGSGCRKSSTRACGTTSMPLGLQRADASLATNFVGATPTEQVSPSSSSTRRRMAAAMCPGRPCSRVAPETSRNASSSDSGSTSGVTSRRMRHDGVGRRAVGGAVRRQHDGVRAAAQGLGHRHGAADAVAAGLVGRRRHHAAVAAADHDRPAAQLRAALDLDAGVEGVHVDVQHRAAGVVAVPGPGRAGQVGATTHRSSIVARAGAAGEQVDARGEVGERRPAGGRGVQLGQRLTRARGVERRPGHEVGEEADAVPGHDLEPAPSHRAATASGSTSAPGGVQRAQLGERLRRARRRRPGPARRRAGLRPAG